MTSLPVMQRAQGCVCVCVVVVVGVKTRQRAAAVPPQEGTEQSRTNRVVSARVVVRGVLLARDELLRVVEVAVRARADLVHARRLEVNHQAARDELSGTGLCEERVEAVVLDSSALGLLAVCQLRRTRGKARGQATGATNRGRSLHRMLSPGWMPCSRQKSSQQALPVWTPACKTAIMRKWHG
jgi:hypothetical protein